MRKQPHPPSWAMNLRTSSRELSGYSIANEPSACLLGVAAVEASALPASLVPLNLVGLRTKLFMEFNLGRNSAPTLHGLTRAPELSRQCTVARFDDFFTSDPDIFQQKLALSL